MINQLVLVGRIVNEIELKELESGQKVGNITVAVLRNFKNMNGEYETDFIDCKLFGNISERVNEYIKKGDVVGIKGRIQNISVGEQLEKNNLIEIIAEKVTNLSSKPKDNEN